MSIFQDDREEIDSLYERIDDLQNALSDLEAACSTMESENNNLKSEIEEMKKNHSDKVDSLLSEVNDKTVESLNIFYELYAENYINQLSDKKISAVEAFEEIVDHHIICDLVTSSMEMKLGFFHEDEDERVLKDSYKLGCESIERVMKDISDVLNESEYQEFITSICKEVSLCPTNILAILNEYTNKNIDISFIKALPPKVKNSVARSLSYNFYMSNNYIANTMMNSINSYALGLPYTSAMKELFILLWDDLQQEKMKVKMRDHDNIGSKINSVVNYKRGYRHSKSGIVGLGEYMLINHDDISDDFWQTYFHKNTESFLSFYKRVIGKENGNDCIKKLPRDIRNEVNKLKMKGDFK